MDETEKIIESAYHRIAHFAPRGDPRNVYVAQRAEEYGRGFVWGSATIGWTSAIADSTPAQARQFAERLQAAADLAEKWDDERRGRGVDGTLQAGAE